ncbi:MAG TPA: metallopeptidase family protein [Nitrospiria bacterium]|nr:metallopeptidase family protein [Nitrospiria bacterium]
MDRKSFEKLVQEALDRIPSEFQCAMKNVAVVIQDRPGPEVDEDRDGEEADELYGLYQGVPLPDRSADDSGTTPDIIFLYQKPLEEDFPDREDLIREIEITVVHEIAHYFGFDEEALERYGYD